MKNLWIALVDDWELRGNGRGNVLELQYRPAMRLMDLYDNLGVKATFNAEVMQQLAFEKVAARCPEIKTQRDYWLEAVQTMIARGFDVQLHIHPQWYQARYDGHFWELDPRWNITDYKDEEIRTLIKESWEYLSHLVGQQPIVSFRAGAWGACCPSRTLLEALEEHGILMDISVVNGIYYEGESIRLDYTNLESPNFPYYPDYDDIRKVASIPGKIVEIPTQTIPVTLLKETLSDRLEKKVRSVAEKIFAPKRMAYDASPPDSLETDPFGFLKGTVKHAASIFDISLDLSLSYFKKASDIIIKRSMQQIAFTDNLIPLIFTNHTKDLIRDSQFLKIAKIIDYIQATYKNDVEFKTLKEIANNLSHINPRVKN